MPTVEKTDSSLITYGSIHDVVTERIRQMILSDQLEPGERLRQEDLAKTFGVSTMPVREALRRLQAEGLVVFYPRRGAAVAELSLSEFQEIFRIREELEVLACRWVAEDFSRIPLDHLREVLTDLKVTEAELDVPRRLELVREFFFAIFEASEKQHLLRLLSSLWDLSQQYRRAYSAIPDIVPARLEHYRRIYHACEARNDEELTQAMRELYAFVREVLIPHLRENDHENGEKPG